MVRVCKQNTSVAYQFLFLQAVASKLKQNLTVEKKTNQENAQVSHYNDGIRQTQCLENLYLQAAIFTKQPKNPFISS